MKGGGRGWKDGRRMKEALAWPLLMFEPPWRSLREISLGVRCSSPSNSWHLSNMNRADECCQRGYSISCCVQELRSALTTPKQMLRSQASPVGAARRSTERGTRNRVLAGTRRVRGPKSLG